MSNINAADLPRVSWMGAIAGGTIWAVVYNVLWGLAWFAFMRREWRDAFAAIRSPLVFTAEVWVFWIALTLPIGTALIAYAANPMRSVPAFKAAVYAATTLWLLMTLGMAIWGWQESLSLRIIALDSIVNLVAMVSASLFGTWSHRKSSASIAGPA